MAFLNKNSKTPSNKNGPIGESSAGKQRNFLFPVRIKVTPPKTLAGSLSDGKKNVARMTQPVLIKDLLQSSCKKNKQSSTVVSVSTQKKKDRPLKSTQPYLNTQSCYKPKSEEDELTLFNRKSYGGSKVRRQLYQNLDSPPKVALENKENANKVLRPKKKVTKATEDRAMKNSQIQNKSRSSFLLPPNSIKNTFIRKSESNVKASGKHNVKSSTTAVNKFTKGIKKIIQSEVESEMDSESNFSSPSTISREQSYSCKFKDNSTMTSPSLSKQVSLNTSSFDLNKMERPTVIMTPSKTKSAVKQKHKSNPEPLCLEMQNLKIDKTPCNCEKKSNSSNGSLKYPEYDFSQINSLDNNGIMQFQTYLEQNLETAKNYVSNLELMISFLKSMSNSNSTATTNTESNKSFEISNEKSDLCNKAANVLNDSNSTVIMDKSSDKGLENPNTPNAMDTSEPEKNKVEIGEKLPIPIKVLIAETDSIQDTKEISLDSLSEMQRLSTIGEVSYETDDLSKDDKNDSENKENVEDYLKSMTTGPKLPSTPKTPSRRTKTTAEGCDSQSRRRSARLAAKRASLSLDSDKQDSFTLLENELNVVYDPVVPAWKSLPASPMKPPITPGLKQPVTPGLIRQWDKRVERPLQEYMALKMNGTFLVTPDIKKFQSRLEPTDTPHSRKSLSRKIFMELCDLYAESPEHK